jgi:hypothetical protein
MDRKLLMSMEELRDMDLSRYERALIATPNALLPVRFRRGLRRIWRRCAWPGSDAKLCYAMKANPFLTGELARSRRTIFEVCSPGELRICRRAGRPMEKVVLSGVYKDPDELEAVFSQGLPVGTFTAESPAQWTLLAGLAKKYARTVHVLLRLTSGAQFGIERAGALPHGGAGAGQALRLRRRAPVLLRHAEKVGDEDAGGAAPAG